MRYVIPVLWHGSGDAVTWEYASGSGNIVAEDDGTPLEDVSAQSVTNNCEYAALLDLQADTLALNDGDPVGTWADQSGNSRDFTQTGAERPTKQTISTYPAVVFDGIDDWMTAGNFADNLPSLEVMVLLKGVGSPAAIAGPQLAKVYVSEDMGTYIGWGVFGGDYISLMQSDGAFITQGVLQDIDWSNFNMLTLEVLSKTSINAYLNGELGNSPITSGTVTDYSNGENVMIGMEGGPGGSGDAGHTNMICRSIMLLAPAPSATNRAALISRLAARYGVTL